ncbi:MAG TPA: sigma-70 family RNA polymerase sigma factor [Terriglobia bacterium]|nr:sigma-70 family RNA polymerase sigma factor [Terriglobia bacterium]
MEQDDGVVVALALAGDSDAFRTLVERHSRAIFRLAYRMTSNEQDAEDVVQETFLRAYKRLKQFESRANFGTWLHRIAVNCALDCMRLRQRHDTGRESIDAVGADGPQPLPAGDPLPDRVLFSAEVQQQIDGVLAGLSPKEKAAFVLRHFEGMSIEEISRTMGLRSEAAKNNIFRAVKKLRKALAPLTSVAG